MGMHSPVCEPILIIDSVLKFLEHAEKEMDRNIADLELRKEREIDEAWESYESHYWPRPTV